MSQFYTNDHHWEQTSAIATLEYLQRRVLKAANGTRDPDEAFVWAYEHLPERLKIAFLLSGKAHLLLSAWQRLQQRNRKHSCLCSQP